MRALESAAGHRRRSPSLAHRPCLQGDLTAHRARIAPAAARPSASMKPAWQPALTPCTMQGGPASGASLAPVAAPFHASKRGRTAGQGHCFLPEQTGESRLIGPTLSHSPRCRRPSSLSIHRARSRVRPKPCCHDAPRNKRAHPRGPLRRAALPAAPADNVSPNAPQEVDPLC
jgi:hypothetical protein